MHSEIVRKHATGVLKAFKGVFNPIWELPITVKYECSI